MSIFERPKKYCLKKIGEPFEYFLGFWEALSFWLCAVIVASGILAYFWSPGLEIVPENYRPNVEALRANYDIGLFVCLGVYALLWLPVLYFLFRAVSTRSASHRYARARWLYRQFGWFRKRVQRLEKLSTRRKKEFERKAWGERQLIHLWVFLGLWLSHAYEPTQVLILLVTGIVWAYYFFVRM